MKKSFKVFTVLTMSIGIVTAGFTGSSYTLNEVAQAHQSSQTTVTQAQAQDNLSTVNSVAKKAVKKTAKKNTKKSKAKSSVKKKSVKKAKSYKKVTKKKAIKINKTISVPYVYKSGGIRKLQSQIDTCRTVDGTKYYNLPILLQHFHCGGNQFPTAKGKIVKVTGNRAGTYKVLGVVKWLNVYKNTTADVPRGYDLVYQTCLKGSTKMGIVALKKIG